MGIKPSNKCEDCNAVESLDHMFFSCLSMEPFWYQISQQLRTITGLDEQLSMGQALFGLSKDDNEISFARINEANHLLLLAKLCITKHRFSKPSNLLYILEYEILLRKKHFTYLFNKWLCNVLTQIMTPFHRLQKKRALSPESLCYLRAVSSKCLDDPCDTTATQAADLSRLISTEPYHAAGCQGHIAVVELQHLARR